MARVFAIAAFPMSVDVSSATGVSNAAVGVPAFVLASLLLLPSCCCCLLCGCCCPDLAVV
jgi:hypothetical protein